MANSTNAAEFTVSEISYAVKSSIEDQFGYVRVRGELGRVSRPASGHIYLDLKDDKSVLNGVIWRGAAQKMTVRPEQGLEVIATGKLTTFPGQSKYQMVIDRMEPAGAGALMALLEERKKKLASEGLFAPERKKRLPYLPRVIGVVTSPSGAVIRDILHRVADRFPVHVLVWPVRVQGETCAQEVANGIKGFNALPQGGGIPRPDLIIVARGGGSLEDLWGFNEEEPVRAAAMSDIPLISAVGHETDVTLIDYAADLRAPTPTGAAEMALPVKSDLLATLGDLHLRQSGAVMRMMERRRSDLRSASRALPQPKDLLALARQRFDMASSRLGQSLQAATLNHRNRLATSSVRLRPTLIANKITLHKERLQDRGDRLTRISLRGLEQKRTQLDSATRLMESLSHKGVLARGFALVRNRDDEMIRQADQVSAGQGLSLEFADGHVSVVAGLLDPVALTPSDKDKQSIAAQQEENVSGIMASKAISAQDIEANLRSLAGVKGGAKSGKEDKGRPSKSSVSASSKGQSQPEKPKPKSRKSTPPKDDDAQGSLF
ncbi:MAG: exodeoxyribonuclease VII large subunit [Cohaesibacter sp.]|nr:exodeoxyribonuclease VII large subunit [Cohaesibacter sp.]